MDLIKNCKTDILDLGCGIGCDSIYLSQKGFSITACDFSQVALDKLKISDSKIKTLLIDISKPLPFDKNSFDVIIADLSLHYFDNKTTMFIMKNIKRILTSNGVLIARVNSLLDSNHGAGQGVQIEKNYFVVKGYNKRFFNKEEIDKYFSIIGDFSARETNMLRNGKSKIIWEIVAKKNSPS